MILSKKNRLLTLVSKTSTQLYRFIVLLCERHIFGWRRGRLSYVYRLFEKFKSIHFIIGLATYKGEYMYCRVYISASVRNISNNSWSNGGSFSRFRRRRHIFNRCPFPGSRTEKQDTLFLQTHSLGGKSCVWEGAKIFHFSFLLFLYRPGIKIKVYCALLGVSKRLPQWKHLWGGFSTYNFQRSKFWYYYSNIFFSFYIL